MVKISSSQKNNSIIFFVIFGLLAFWSVIVQDTLWGAVYSNVFYISLLLIILSWVRPKVFEYIPVSSDRLIQQIVVGFVLGLALVGSLIISNFQFSFLSPLSIPEASGVLGVLGLSAVTFVFVNSIMISEFEETLRSATLRPSVYEWLGKSNSAKGLSIVLFIFGIITYFIIGVELVGLALAGFALLSFFRETVFLRSIRSELVRRAISIVFVGVFFALLHFTAYSSPGSTAAGALMFNAFLYAVIADLINGMYTSTIPSRIAHTLNNAAIASIAVGVPVYFAFVVAGVHTLIMYMIARS